MTGIARHENAACLCINGNEAAARRGGVHLMGNAAQRDNGAVSQNCFRGALFEMF